MKIESKASGYAHGVPARHGCKRHTARRLITLLAAVFLCASAWSASTTDATFITTSSSSWTTNSDKTLTATDNEVTVTLASGVSFSGSNGGYVNNITSFTATSSYTITKIAVYYQREDNLGINSTGTTTGTITNPSDKTFDASTTPSTWEGSASSVTIAFINSEKVRVTKIVVTRETTSLPTPVLTISNNETKIGLNTTSTKTPTVTVGDKDSAGNAVSADNKATILKGITWSSSDANIVSVDATTGVITSYNTTGSAKITATSPIISNVYNSTTVTYDVTVEDTRTATKLALSGTKTSMDKSDDAFTVTATLTDASGNALKGKSCTVASSDESAATVSESTITTGSNGTATFTVSPVGRGTTTITVGYDGDTDYTGSSDEFTLTVADKTDTGSQYDDHNAVGFAAGTKGGAGGAVYYADTHDKLIAALQGDEKATVYVSGTIYFCGADTLNGVKNKSIIGLPGARLQNAVTRYGKLTGSQPEGGSDNDYKGYLKDNSNSSDAQATVWNWLKDGMDVDKTGILCLKECDNIIIQNLAFEGEGDFDIDGKDNLTLHGSTNIWVDHCEFQDGIDGNFDCIHASDNVAVTWCKFFYEKKSKTDSGVTGDSSKGHKDCNLWGHNEDNDDEDGGKLNTTFANCYWGDNVKDRMPRVRFGKVHLYNCLYDISFTIDGASLTACITAGKKANVTAENCVFKNEAANKNKPCATKPGYTSLTLVNCLKGTASYSYSEGTKFTPDYTYNKYDVNKTEEQVRTYAGQTLSTSVSSTDDPASVTITMGKEYASYCSPYPLDFSNVSGLKAYAATKLVTDDTQTDITLTKVKMSQVAQAAGGTGLILKSDNASGGTFTVPVNADLLEKNVTTSDGKFAQKTIKLKDGNEIQMLDDLDNTAVSSLKNYLVGVVTKTKIGMNTLYFFDESYACHRRRSNDFVLKDGAFHPSYWSYLSPGKAYLAADEGTILDYEAKPSTQSTIALTFDDEGTSGITEAVTSTTSRTDGAWYTLSGVRVEKPQRGVYIHNGKKVVVR